MNLHIVLNPASSSGRGAKMAPRLTEALHAHGLEFVLHRTEAPGHGERLVGEALQQGATHILAVGGDGTIHEVANGLLDRDAGATPMAVLPVGTGNDFYRMVGAPKDLPAVIRTLVSGQAKPFDVGHVTFPDASRFFVNLLGFGIDVEVLQRRERVRRLSGLAQYLAALLGAVASFEAVAATVTLDDGTSVSGRTTLAGITVGPSAGGGFLLSPTATPDDGLLDLCWVDELSLLQILRYIPKVIRGTHAGLDVVELHRFRTAHVAAPEGGVVQVELDGELVRTPVATMDIKVVPGALSVMVPAEAS